VKAIIRGVSPSIHLCELTHLQREPIDYERASAQHQQYAHLLASLGCQVIEIAADPAYPDCVFIEDTALVFDDVAVITRPGAESRRGEVTAVADVLTQYRRLESIEAPATVDGGDVLILDDRIYVGLSERTNTFAIEQLARYTDREVIPVRVDGCLHLKTAVTRVGDDALLVNRAWIDVAPFDDWKLIDIDPSEPFAANAMLVDDVIVYPNAFPKTLAKLPGEVRTVDASELAKAEGGVTCCALLVSD
jgi:dimethylargininase